MIAVLSVLLHIETDQNARKTEISRRLEKKFLGPVSVGSLETQVFFFLALSVLWIAKHSTFFNTPKFAIQNSKRERTYRRYMY